MSSLSSAISRSARPATKASAVIAISGAMVASLALPASAASHRLSAKAASAAPVALASPAVASAPMVVRSFGTIGFTGVDKPKPVVVPVVVEEPVVEEPVVAERTTARVSRSSARTPVAPAPTPTPEAPVAAPAPRSGGVLDIAAGLAGIPYVYGGTTPAGFDCSGFTQYVFGKAGISLPRTAEAQRQAATTVTDPQPGDLVFFGSPAHHMGIYAGDGMLWDSPRTGKSVSKRSLWTSDVTYGRV